jgi:RNA polymerase sigma-70 factor (ECF subfamily)
MGTSKERQLAASPLLNKRDVSADLSLLLDQARDGNSDAFEAIYDVYAGRIYSYVFRMVSMKEDAEDITQEVFFLAYANLKHLRENANFEPWLYKIARNQVFKVKRKNKAKPESLDDEGRSIRETLKSSDSGGNPEGKLLSGELGGTIQTVLQSLPINYRETLMLATIHGLSYKDISVIMGRSLSSVKTDVYRARLIIADKMKKYLLS